MLPMDLPSPVRPDDMKQNPARNLATWIVAAVAIVCAGCASPYEEADVGADEEDLKTLHRHEGRVMYQ